jgi:cytochrome c oxidase cbb3-type subunit IV
LTIELHRIETVMDMNLARSLVTIISFVMFLGIAWWAWQARRRPEFEQAQMLPFLDEGGAGAPVASSSSQPSPHRESIHE